MSGQKAPCKRRYDSRTASASKSTDNHTTFALAAITSTKSQHEVQSFIEYLLETLKNNSIWLNNVIDSSTFKCALLQGAGPNRFQLREIIYPSEDIKLEVEIKESDGYDKVAVAALLRISKQELTNILDFMRYRLSQHRKLKNDFLRGKAMGIYFAVLRPINESIFRIMERIVIDSDDAMPKRKTEKASFGKSAPKRARKVAL